jgi:hypothetical protein
MNDIGKNLKLIEVLYKGYTLVHSTPREIVVDIESATTQ